MLEPFRDGTNLLHGLYADDQYDLSTVILKADSIKNNYRICIDSARTSIENEFGLPDYLSRGLHVKYIWMLLKLCI